MIDNKLFEYIPTDTPNLTIRETKGATPVPTILHPFMEPLVRQIMKARPTWKLVCTSRSYSHNGGNPSREGHTFVLYADNEELGKLGMGVNHDDKRVYEMDSPRLKAARQRGWVTTTSDIKKAFKIITKSFAPRNMAEQLHDARNIIGNAVNLAAQQGGFGMREVQGYLFDEFHKFALANYEEFHKAVSASAVNTASKERKLRLLDEFPEAYELNTEANKLRTYSANNAGFNVLLRSSDYIINPMNQTVETQILTSEELSPHMRMCIGMLKLATDGQFIPGVGVRATETSLYVVPEETKGE